MAMTPANPFRRFFAYAVDWYVCTMLCGAPLMLVNSMRTGLAEIDTSLPPGASGYGWGLAAFAIGAAYYVLFPLFWHGQTPGKRLFRLRIVADGGKTPGAPALVLRQLVGVLLIEGAVAFPSQLLREMLARAAGDGAANLVRIAMVALTILSVCLGLYTPGRRMLHDLLSGTREVSAA